MTLCARWLTHTNPICVRDSGEILRDKSRLPGPTIVCWFVEGKMALKKLSRIFHLNHPRPANNVFVFFLLVKFSGNFLISLQPKRTIEGDVGKKLKHISKEMKKDYDRRLHGKPCFVFKLVS